MLTLHIWDLCRYFELILTNGSLRRHEWQISYALRNVLLVRFNFPLPLQQLQRCTLQEVETLGRLFAAGPLFINQVID